MNEPANHWNGTQDGACDRSSNLDYPPYVPAVSYGALHFRSFCASAKQYAGSHYNVHNLFGTQEAISTYRYDLSLTRIG